VVRPGERLNAGQWAGVALAFLGVALAFADGFSMAKGSTLIGDAFGVIAAALWAATTVLIRSTRLTSASATKTLFYQLGISALVLPLASMLAGEPGIIALTPTVVASLAYQSMIVAFASYLAWFWLLTRYLAGRLAVFSFLTPLFGVAFGVIFLSEPLSAAFLGAALLVGAGIVLVNRPTNSDYDGLCEKVRPNTVSAIRFLRISIEPPAIIQPRQRRTQYSTSAS